MIRLVIYLVIIGLLAFAAAWLADRPGDVLITWQGQRIETSVMVLIVGVAIIAVFATMVWTIVRALLRSPDILWLYLRSRRGVRGYLAVSHGLIAVGSGDARAARKLADEASRIAPGEPLTLLLNAQASQLSGDRATAERTFQVMAGRQDTRLLGLHGLFIEAQRRNDGAAARLYAEEAASQAPVPSWAGHAVFQACCAAGDWPGALERLDRNMKSGLVDRATFQRQRAVLLTALAIAAEDGNRDRARALVLDAIKLAPTLVPAAALAGRMLGDAGDQRRAGRIVETAWLANPHPDLADTFAHLRPGSSARDRLARVEALAQKSHGDREGALAVARAALDAQEFGAARAALLPLLAVPTQRVAVLMAELEELEHGDDGRAREWMTRAVHARRDPAWTADGVVSERWMPVSPVTGRLDAFQWRDPFAELGGDAPMIDDAKSGPVSGTGRRIGGRNGDRREERDGGRDAERSQARDVIDAPPVRAAPVTDLPVTFSQAPEASSGLPDVASPRLGRKKVLEGAPPAVERVIPLVHVPDDPGPNPDRAREPEIEPVSGRSNDGWGRLRGLFK